MIRRKVSAVLLVRDGFTGRPVTSGSALICLLDGQPVRPLFKPGGYLVLTDLEPGDHTFVLSARGFHGETVSLPVSGNGMLELETVLRPGPGYAFPPYTARLRLTLSDGSGVLAEEAFWIGLPAPVQLRLAQEVGAGDEANGEPNGEQNRERNGEQGREPDGGRSGTDRCTLRMFCTGAESRLPVPGYFLLLDDQRAEKIHLRSLRDGVAELDAPPCRAYPRGTRLVPAYPFRTDGEGRVMACFPQEGTVSLFCREKRRDVDLRSGTADFSWNLAEET